MCTRIFWTGKVENVSYSISGRNMDWSQDMKEKIWVFPVGLQRKSAVTGKGVEWVSKYGSIIVSAYDQATSDGMNTEGLAIHSNWLNDGYYGERDQSKPGIDADRTLQYFLDKFATVQEVVEHLRYQNKDMQLVPTTVPFDNWPGNVRKVQGHLAVEDAKGESAVIEYVKGDNGEVKKNIYYSGDLPHYSGEYSVMTNDPTFDKQLSNLKKYKGFGGELDLPGASDSASRFVRAAFYLKSLPEPANQREAIAGVLSVLRSSAQPFRVPESGRPYASSTQWRTVASLTEKLYMFESSLYPTLIWLDANKLDFKEGSGVRVFDLAKNRQAIGDVSDKLTAAKDLFGNNVCESYLPCKVIKSPEAIEISLSMVIKNS